MPSKDREMSKSSTISFFREYDVKSKYYSVHLMYSQMKSMNTTQGVRQ